MEIIPKVHHIPGVRANPYLILEKEGLTLIDAGLPGSQRGILRYIASLGYAPKDLRRIIITHSDIDHIGGLAALKTASGGQVFASAIEAEAIGKGTSSRTIRPANPAFRLLIGLLGSMVKARPVKVDEILSEGQVLPALDGLKVLETPGHTPGHISLFAPAAGILFCGDSLVSRDGALLASLEANTWDRAKADESVRKQAALGAKIVCSGHGEVVWEAGDKFPKV